MQTQNKWSALVLKSWKGAISKPDRDELEHHRSVSTMKDEQFRRVTSPRWMINMLRGIHSFDREQSWNCVLARAGSLPESIQLPASKWRFNWTAAACLAGLLLLAVSIYYMLGKKSAAVADDDILTLPNKARLVWHDSTSFVLDEMQDGLLVKTGDAEVLKSNGVIYLKGPTLLKDTVAQINELILPEGSHYKLSLPDGTLVSMNASSRIRFPTQFSRDVRRVEIEGLGYLNIAKNPDVPFEVKLGKNYTVRALGTSFVVQSYADEKQSSVSLIEGSVAVNKYSASGNPTILSPLQKYISEGNMDTVIACPNIKSDVQALETGKFNLEKDLKSILRDIAKWYGVKLSFPKGIENPVLYGFVDRQQSLSSVLSYIQPSVKPKIRFFNNVIIVSKK